MVPPRIPLRLQNSKDKLPMCSLFRTIFPGDTSSSFSICRHRLLYPFSPLSSPFFESLRCHLVIVHVRMRRGHVAALIKARAFEKHVKPFFDIGAVLEGDACPGYEEWGISQVYEGDRWKSRVKRVRQKDVEGKCWEVGIRFAEKKVLTVGRYPSPAHDIGNRHTITDHVAVGGLC